MFPLLKNSLADYKFLAIFLQLFEDISPLPLVSMATDERSVVSLIVVPLFLTLVTCVIFLFLFDVLPLHYMCVDVGFLIFLSFWWESTLVDSGVFLVSGKFSTSISSNIASPPFCLILFFKNLYHVYLGVSNCLSSFLHTF